MKQRSKAFLAGRVVVVAMGLAACSDLIAPTVSSTTPTDDSTEVDTSAVITATFDENILATTVDGTSFTLQDNVGDVSGTVTFDGASNVTTFTPTALGLARQYTATLTTSITDLAGNALASNYSWQFTTRDGNWGTATVIENNNAGMASVPQVAFDANGNALVVWNQHDGTRYNIWANRYVAGSGWGTAELIETDNAGSAWGPQVAFDANGNALAVWMQYDGTRYNIWFSRYVEGSGWGTAALIETDNAESVSNPQVAVDASGNALAMWTQFDGTRYNIWSSRYVVGSGWGAAVLIETHDVGDASSAQVAVDGNGNALAVWIQHAPATRDVWSNRYVAGAGWGTAVLIDTDTAEDTVALSNTPQVAVDTNGNGMVVWSKSGGARLNIWSNRYVAGSGWGVAELIEIHAGAAEDPQVAFDANGNALAVWRQEDGLRYNIWSNRYVIGSGWGTAELIETNNVSWASAPYLAVDASGNAVAVWPQDAGSFDMWSTRFDIWSNRYVAGTGWGTAELLETDNAGGAYSPRVGVDANGNALAVWWQSDGTRDNILANRFD